MKVKKAIFFGLVLISFLLPYAAIAQAQKVPSYVGIREGATYTWKTEYDKDPYIQYYEDSGETEAEAEAIVDFLFEVSGLSTKTEAIKIYIVDFYPESEEKWGSNEYDRVKFVYNMYKTKHMDDPEAWKKVTKYDTGKIYENDEDIYKNDVILGYGFNGFFIPKRLHLEDIVDYWDEKIDDFKWDDKNDASINTIEVQYFLQKKVMGISTEWNEKDTSNTESFETIDKFTDDGILYYSEWTYDGDIITKYELDTIGGTYLIENWWWIAILAGAALVVVIVVVVVIIVKKKR